MSSTTYLTTRDLAQRLSLKDPNTVRKLVADQGLPVHRVARRMLFDPVEVDAWVHSRGSQGQVATPVALNPAAAPDPAWVAKQVARFTPDELRRAAEVLTSLARGLDAAPQNGGR